MKKIIAFSILMLLLSPVWASASLGSKQPFSADIHYQEAGGYEHFVMRSFFSMDKIRLERTRGGKGAGIVRFDRDVVWALNQRRHVYWEIPLAPLPEIHLLDLDGTTLYRKKLGRERRNGVLCNKVRVRYQDPVSGRPGVATAWYGIDLGTYVRIEYPDGTVFNLRNIKRGPQPDHLFEVPRHYRLNRVITTPDRDGPAQQPRLTYGPPWFGRPPAPPQRPHRPARKRVPILGDGRLFQNSDFEDGTLHNWTARGDAFRYQPTKADNPTARRSNEPSGHQRHYWIGTYEKYGARLRERPGRIQGDKPTGTLTSKPFTITHERIHFLIGGGNRASKVYVALLINGKVVRKATGGNYETMEPVIWRVGQYAGQQARIKIVDQGTRRWGHINADDFRYAGRALVDVRIVASSRTRPAGINPP